MTRRCSYPAIICALLHASLALGQTSPPQETSFDSDVMLWGEEDTIYSATKFNKRLDQAPAIATVITAEQIRNMGARYLLDALRGVPGVATGMYTGWAPGVEIRGIKTQMSEKILVLIDGQRVNERNLGSGVYVYWNMPVDNIQRIEVIRGPGSALYGANAYMGIINIITKNTDNVASWEDHLAIGNFNTQSYGAQFSHTFQTLKVNGYLNGMESDGPDSWVEQDNLGRSGRIDARQRRFDAYLKAAYNHWTANYYYLNGRRGGYYGIAGALNDHTAIIDKLWRLNIDYRSRVNDQLSLHSFAYYERYNLIREWEIIPAPYFPGGMLGYPRGIMRAWGWENQLDYTGWRNQTITMGLFLARELQSDPVHYTTFDPDTFQPLTPPGALQDITSWGNWGPSVTRDNVAVYLQDLWEINDAVQATLGVRYDHFSDFGSSTNPRLALVWTATEDTTLRALYGRAFRAPSFGEAYTTHNPISLGNRNIKPEEMESLELSLNHRFTQKLVLNLAYFHLRLHKLIDLASGKWDNLGEASSRGLESELKWYADKRDSYAYINHTFQYAKDEKTDKRLPLVPTQKANIGFNWAVNNGWNLNTNLRLANSKTRQANDPRSRRAPGYGVLDISLTERNIFKSTDLQLTVYNAGDKKYVEPSPLDLQGNPIVPSDFIAPGRSWMAQLRHKL